MGRIVLFLLIGALLNPPKAASQLAFRPLTDSGVIKPAFHPMPQKFYTQPTGFFCKKEVQLQQKLRVLLFIRMGSKDYVDYMEGKRKGEGIKN